MFRLLNRWRTCAPLATVEFGHFARRPGSRGVPMGVRTWLGSWPVYRQLTGEDPLARGKAAESPRSAALVPRTATADRVVHSVCPYCAVGCALKVYVKDDRVVQIEGNPLTPISRAELCPKRPTSTQLVTAPQ